MDRTREPTFELKAQRKGQSEAEIVHLDELSGEAFELEDELRIVSQLFRERKPMVTPLEGKKAVVMCNEAERSMLEGREISFSF